MYSQMSRLNYGVSQHIILLSIHLCDKDQSTLHQIDVYAHFSHFYSHHLTIFCSLSCLLVATETVSETGLCLFRGQSSKETFQGHYDCGLRCIIRCSHLRSQGSVFTFPSLHTYCLTVGVSTLTLKIMFQVHCHKNQFLTPDTCPEE